MPVSRHYASVGRALEGKQGITWHGNIAQLPEIWHARKQQNSLEKNKMAATEETEDSQMARKRKRGYVILGPDLDGNTFKKWVQGYSKKQLEDAKKQARLDFQQSMQLELERRESLIAAAPTPKQEVVVQGFSPASLTFEEYARTWYSLYKEPHIRLQTRRMYENVLECQLYPGIGKMELARITKNDLQRFILTFSEKSKSTIDKVMVGLRQIFSAAVEDGLIPRNPAAKLVPPKGTRGERLPISLEAVTSLTNSLQTNDEGLIIFLLLYAGLRRSEAVGLRWGDIKSDGIHVQRAGTFDKRDTIIDLPKSKSAFRTIPILFPQLEAALDRSKRGQDSEYVLSGNALPLSPSDYDRLWAHLRKASPILESVTAHQLRHTFLMLLRRAGVDSATQQYLMGHSEYNTTVNDYTHIEYADLCDAKQLVSENLLPELLPASASSTH